MKQKIIIILLAVLANMGLMQASVFYGTCGNNLYWNFNTTDSTLTITGNGSMTFSSQPWSSYIYIMKYISLPNGLTNIADEAFSGCQVLTNVVIPNSVQTIGRKAFYNCSGLKSVTIGSGVKNIGEDAFYSSPKKLKMVNIVDIAAWCTIDFFGIESNPLNGANYLYYEGELLTDLVIPEGVETIKKYAFVFCESITKLTIPQTVTNIESYAFFCCSWIKTVVNYAENPHSITAMEFYPEDTYCTLYVPNESIDLYSSAEGWKKFKSIQPISNIPASINNINGVDIGTQKVLYNDQILIIRGDKTYTLQGQEVK